MALVFDRRKELAGRLGAHAFLLGISNYPHLPPATSTSRPSEKFQLRQLTLGARSACAFHEWLKTHADQLGAPLKTIRLLVAPSKEEMDLPAIAAAPEIVSPCDVAAVLKEIYPWFEECQRSRGDVAILYFCGNGVELGPSNPAIILSDFGQEAGPRLRGVVSVNNLIQGMAPSQAFENVARTQLFFFDAGRRPVDTFMDVFASTTALFDVPRARLDDRDLLVCHAADAGMKAYGPRGMKSYFLSSLTDCLEGLAAIPDSAERGGAWCVTIDSLARALPQRVSVLSGGKQLPFVNTIKGQAVIVRLDGPPPVPVTISVEPPEAAKGATVDIFDSVLKPAGATLARGKGRFEVLLPAGLYQVHVKFGPQLPDGAARETTFIASVVPPAAQFVVQAKSND